MLPIMIGQSSHYNKDNFNNGNYHCTTASVSTRLTNTLKRKTMEHACWTKSENKSVKISAPLLTLMSDPKLQSYQTPHKNDM